MVRLVIKASASIDPPRPNPAPSLTSTDSRRVIGTDLGRGNRIQAGQWRRSDLCHCTVPDPGGCLTASPAVDPFGAIVGRRWRGAGDRRAHGAARQSGGQIPKPGSESGCAAGPEPAVPGSPHPQHRLEAELNRGQLIRRQRRQGPLTETGAVQGSGLVGHHLAGPSPASARSLHRPGWSAAGRPPWVSRRRPAHRTE